MNQTDQSHLEPRHTASHEQARYMIKYGIPRALWLSTWLMVFTRLENLWQGSPLRSISDIKSVTIIWAVCFLPFMFGEIVFYPSRRQPMSPKAVLWWEKTVAKGRLRFLTSRMGVCAIACGASCVVICYLAFGPPVPPLREIASKMAPWFLVVVLLSFLCIDGVGQRSATRQPVCPRVWNRAFDPTGRQQTSTDEPSEL